MGRRTLLLIASILVAAVGTALIFMYVNGVRRAADEGATMVPVVVAQKRIPRGSTVGQADSDSAFTTAYFPARSAAASLVYRGLGDLTSRRSATALSDIEIGAIIYRSSFADPEQASTSGVETGDLAISVQLSDPGRVASLLRPGNQITVVHTTSGDKGGTPISKVWLSDVKVISIGSEGPTTIGAGASAAENVERKIVSLSLNIDEVLKLRQGEQTGELSLAIRDENSKVPTERSYPQGQGTP
jgi:pilus assembly protein CpaB